MKNRCKKIIEIELERICKWEISRNIEKNCHAMLPVKLMIKNSENSSANKQLRGEVGRVTHFGSRNKSWSTTFSVERGSLARSHIGRTITIVRSRTGKSPKLIYTPIKSNHQFRNPFCCIKSCSDQSFIAVRSEKYRAVVFMKFRRSRVKAEYRLGGRYFIACLAKNIITTYLLILTDS